MCYLCIHEAGHAVVGSALSFTPCGIRVQLKSKRIGGVDFIDRDRLNKNFEASMTILWAGIEAERCLLDEVPKDRKAWKRDRLDIRGACLRSLERVVKDDQCLKEITLPQWKAARQLIEINRSSIWKVALHVHAEAEKHRWGAAHLEGERFQQIILPLLKDVRLEKE